MLVYNPDGVAFDKEPCDARECVKYCGYTIEDPKATVIEQPAVQVIEPKTPKRDRPKSLFGKDEEPTVATLSTVASDVI